MLYKASVGPTALLARNSLLFILRTRFFWAWNLGLLLLAISLNHISFFDIESSSMVSELFLTTLSLSACVNFLVFYLHGTRETSHRAWDLLLSRPIGPSRVVLGRWCGALLFQVLATSALLAAFFLDSRLLHRPLSPSFGRNVFYMLLQVSMLNAFFALVSCAFRELWAFLSMVGGFLLGHLAEHLFVWIPPKLSVFLSVLFCFIPDLELSVTAEMEPSSFGSEELLLRMGYAVFYVAFALGLASLTLRRKLVRS